MYTSGGQAFASSHLVHLHIQMRGTNMNCKNYYTEQPI